MRGGFTDVADVGSSIIGVADSVIAGVLSEDVFQGRRIRLSNSSRSGLRRRSATVTIVSASKLGISLGRQELSKSSMKIGPSGTVGRLRGPEDDTTGPSDGPYRNTRDWSGATW